MISFLNDYYSLLVRFRRPKFKPLQIQPPLPVNQLNPSNWLAIFDTSQGNFPFPTIILDSTGYFYYHVEDFQASYYRYRDYHKQTQTCLCYRLWPHSSAPFAPIYILLNSIDTVRRNCQDQIIHIDYIAGQIHLRFTGLSNYFFISPIA